MLCLSIITVSRNDAARLKITIESCRAFYGDSRFEHVVVDGGSKDDTKSIVAPLFQQKNFSFFSKSDSGIYDAMNNGVLYSKAPLLIFLNCGDVMIASPDEMHRILNDLVADNCEFELDLACFPVLQVGNTKIRTIVPNKLELHKMPVSHQGMIFSRRFVAEKKYQASYQIAGDYDLYLQAKEIKKFGKENYKPIVAVQWDGLASANPFRAYLEYLLIAGRRLVGWSRTITIMKIGFRAIFVIMIKIIFPNKWVVVLRGLSDL